MSDYLKARRAQKEEDSYNKNALKYERYAKRLLGAGEEASKGRYNRKQYARKLKFRADLDSESSGSAKEIRISPELTVVWEHIKKERDPKACEEITRKLLEKPEKEGGCHIVSVEKLKAALDNLADAEDNESLKWMWYALSTDGIEIHPGLISANEEPEGALLGDDCVHALMAGRTGSGKSVALHAIITSLMQEYAPWELNINLADFKIVELSKYGNDEENKAPHVMKIAATDSMEYVLSVMYDMYEKMDIRQKVFAALGLQKLADYRKKFDVVLPREILIVDEFQQMYELASSRQVRMINQLIKMITKLGRATGYHLFFASQSMTNTIGNDVIANFKLRLCLSASDEVSSKVLGNNAASQLTDQKGKGYLITNSEGGSAEYNKEYQVPFVRENDDGTGDLANVLRYSAQIAKAAGYQKSMDFYKEDYHRRMTGDDDSFEKDLERFVENAGKLAANRDEIDFYLLLGDSCVYAKNAQKNTSLEYCPIKIGDKKNIVCVGDSVLQRAYMIKLIASQYIENEKQSHGGNQNFIVPCDMLVNEALDLTGNGFEEVSVKDFTDKVVKEMTPRRVMYAFIQYPKEQRTRERLYQVVCQFCRDSSKEKLDSVVKRKAMTQQEADEELDKALNGMCDNLWNNYLKNTENGALAYQFKKEKRKTFWVNGFHLMSDLLSAWCRGKTPAADFLRVCTNMGIRFIFAGTSLVDMPVDIRKCMGYYFIMSNDEKNFANAGLEQGNGYRDDIIRFKAEKEVLNKQKPGLYILGQDEKIVKMYEMENADAGNIERELFQGI